MKVSVASTFPVWLADWEKKSLSLETDVLCAVEEGWLRGRGVGREERGCALSWQQPQEDHGGKDSRCKQACPLCSPRCSDCTMRGIGNHSSLFFFSLSAVRFGYSLQYIRKILFSSWLEASYVARRQVTQTAELTIHALKVASLGLGLQEKDT